MSDAALADVAQRLAVLLDAGVPLTRALATLERERRRRLRRLARALAAGVAQGQTFAEAAAARPDLVAPAHVPLLRAGEQCGRLPETLKRLADSLERVRQWRVRLWTSLLYPVIVFHLAVLALTAVKTILQFTANGPQLGWHPAAGLAFAAAVLGPVYGVAAAAWAAGRAGRRWPVVGVAVESAAALLPGVGPLRRHLAVARFARTLEGLYAAGINLARAVELAAAAADHALLRRRLQPVVAAVAGGADLACAVTAADVFAPDVTALIVTGVEGGRLDAMLLKAAEYEEERAAQAAKILSTLLPLLLVLLVGAVLVYFILRVFGSYVGALNNLVN